MSETRINKEHLNNGMMYSAFYWKKKYNDLLEQYHTLLHKCYAFYQHENQEYGNDYTSSGEYGNDYTGEYGNDYTSPDETGNEEYNESDYNNVLYSLFQNKNNQLVKELMKKSIEISNLHKEMGNHNIPVSPPPITPIPPFDMSLNKAFFMPPPLPHPSQPNTRAIYPPMQPKPIPPNKPKGFYPYYNPYYNSYYNQYYNQYCYPYYDSYYPYLYRDAKVVVPSTSVPSTPVPPAHPIHSYKL